MASFSSKSIVASFVALRLLFCDASDCLITEIFEAFNLPSLALEGATNTYVSSGVWSKLFLPNEALDRPTNFNLDFLDAHSLKH